jgi:hypothetical protein
VPSKVGMVLRHEIIVENDLIIWRLFPTNWH